MEDAVEALKLAAWVLIFILALSIVFMVFSQAKEVADIVLNYSDNTYFASYVEAETSNGNGRTVGIETVIPTLYRYYKEKYSVDIVVNDKIEEKFDEEIERKVYSRNDDTYKYLYENGIPWLANPNIDIKNRVSAYIGKNADTVNDIRLSKYANKSLKNYKDQTFTETFRKVENVPEAGIYVAEDGSTIELLKGTTKTYITYTLNN